MKKVLVVTNLFHASPRIPGMVKYLKDSGWEAVVLATPLGENPESRFGPPNDFSKNFRVIEVKYPDFIAVLKRLAGFKTSEGSRAQLEKRFGAGGKRSFIKPVLRKLMIWAGTILAYPDEMWVWRKPAIKAGKELLSKEKFDIILSSSSPVTSHRIAKALKKYSSLPWVADLRDLWTQNHNYMYPEVRKYFETRLELRTMKDADAMTTVSAPLVDHLKSRYKNIDICSIPNGFDPENVNEPPMPLSPKFTITYTGTIYTGKQDPKKILSALKELIEEKKINREKTELRFYGIYQNWLQEEIVRFGLEDVVKQCGSVSRSESFLRQRESQALLVLGWDDPTELGAFPLKTFEYMAARRPILATGGTPEEKFKKMIDETKAGRHSIDVPGIKQILSDYYRQYEESGQVVFSGDPQKIDAYSYRAMARKFADIFEKTISSRTVK